MAKDSLTRKQRTLVIELDALMSKLGLDYPNILLVKKELRTALLELIKDQLIRSQVILKYVLIGEFLRDIICWYFLGKRRSFEKLWKTKHFRIFKFFILEKLYLQQKLDLIKNMHNIPKWVSSEIGRLNDLRNALAHSFFPENRRRKPERKGKSISTVEGIGNFLDDMQKVADFFDKKFIRRSPEYVKI